MIDGVLYGLLRSLPTFFVAAVVSLYGVPVAIRAATRFGIVDPPDDRLKRHGKDTPYLGGLAVYGAVLIALALSVPIVFDRRLLGMLVGSAILVLVGLIDDLGVLGYGAKFMGEGIAALVAVRGGVVIELHYGGGVLELAVNTIVSIFWLVLLTNAVNLIDIMDGLATSAGMVASLFLVFVAALNGRPGPLCLAAALVGALAGFLRFNWRPARIYLGDAGALSVGFLLGALSLTGSYTMENPLGFLAPLLILGVPLFDTIFVSVIRLAHGRSPFVGSPDHFAIRLRRRGFSVEAIVLVASAAGLLLGVGAVALLFVGRLYSLVIVGLTLLLAGIVSAYLLIGVPREAETGAAGPPPSLDANAR